MVTEPRTPHIDFFPSLGFGGSDLSFQSERNLLLKSASVAMSDDGPGEGQGETGYIMFIYTLPRYFGMKLVQKKHLTNTLCSDES